MWDSVFFFIYRLFIKSFLIDLNRYLNIIVFRLGSERDWMLEFGGFNVIMVLSELIFEIWIVNVLNWKV